MRRYDGSFGGGWGPRPAPRRGGYEWNRPPREIMGGGGWSPRDVQYGRWDVPAGYDRGLYGGGYEAPAGRYAEPPRRGGWGGYAGEMQEEWQGGYARGPFLPEHAYHRHPELNREPGPRGERWGYGLDDTGRELDDEEILDAVRRKLYEDVWVDIDRVDVEVEDGVVTLRGEVDDFMEARYAWDDAWETEGVRGVINHLTVRVDQPVAEQHGDVVPQSTQGTMTEPVEQQGDRE
ncbi:MAG: BON domain-containing protein [Gemmatimonadetes bacterium]|nr:BON domain-containing protein [Gemmatimonadota bacterium]